MRKVLLFLCALFMCVNSANAGWYKTYRIEFDNDGIAGDGDTITSGAVRVGDSTGDISIMGTATSSTEDKSLIFTIHRSDGTTTQTDTEDTFNSTALTSATTFNYGLALDTHVRYIVIKCTNGAGEEAATLSNVELDVYYE